MKTEEELLADAEEAFQRKMMEAAFEALGTHVEMGEEDIGRTAKRVILAMRAAEEARRSPEALALVPKGAPYSFAWGEEAYAVASAFATWQMGLARADLADTHPHSRLGVSYVAFAQAMAAILLMNAAVVTLDEDDPSPFPASSAGDLATHFDFIDGREGET